MHKMANLFRNHALTKKRRKNPTLRVRFFRLTCYFFIYEYYLILHKFTCLELRSVCQVKYVYSLSKFCQINFNSFIVLQFN
jgi:hypothetical protein